MQLNFVAHFDLARTNTALAVFLLCTTANITADILSLKQTWQYQYLCVHIATSLSFLFSSISIIYVLGSIDQGKLTNFE